MSSYPYACSLCYCYFVVDATAIDTVSFISLFNTLVRLFLVFLKKKFSIYLLFTFIADKIFGERV